MQYRKPSFTWTTHTQNKFPSSNISRQSSDESVYMKNSKSIRYIKLSDVTVKLLNFSAANLLRHYRTCIPENSYQRIIKV